MRWCARASDVVEVVAQGAINGNGARPHGIINPAPLKGTLRCRPRRVKRLCSCGEKPSQSLASCCTPGGRERRLARSRTSFLPVVWARARAGGAATLGATCLGPNLWRRRCRSFVRPSVLPLQFPGRAAVAAAAQLIFFSFCSGCVKQRRGGGDGEEDDPYSSLPHAHVPPLSISLSVAFMLTSHSIHHFMTEERQRDDEEEEEACLFSAQKGVVSSSGAAAKANGCGETLPP